MPDTISVTDTETGKTETMAVVTPRTEAELRAYLARATGERVTARFYGDVLIRELHRDADGTLIARVSQIFGSLSSASVPVDALSFEEGA